MLVALEGVRVLEVGSNLAAHFVGRQLAELGEPKSRVDVVTQHELAGVDVSGKHAFDALLQQSLPEFRIAPNACLHSFLEVSGKCHLNHLCPCVACIPAIAHGRPQCRVVGDPWSRLREE